MTQPGIGVRTTAANGSEGRAAGIDLTRRRIHREGLIFLAGFALGIPAANWLIGNTGKR